MGLQKASSETSLTFSPSMSDMVRNGLFLRIKCKSITLRQVSGEGNNVNLEVLKEWISNKWSTLQD